MSDAVLATAQDAEQSPGPLRVMSLNLWMFPQLLPLSQYGDDRMTGLIKYVRDNHEKFDVLAFQELWSSDLRLRFQQEVADLYPFSRLDNEPGGLWFGLGSGLAIFSKYPITRSVQHAFTSYRGPEDFARKGCMIVELRVGNRNFYLIDTHLQGGTGGADFADVDIGKPSTEEIATTQLQEIRQTLADFIIDKTAGRLLVGDFNITDTGEEHDAMLKTLAPVRDTHTNVGSLTGSHWNNFGEPNEKVSNDRVDFMFILDRDFPGTSIVFDMGKTMVLDPDTLKPKPFDISDHLPTLGTFDLSTLPTAPPTSEIPLEGKMVPDLPDHSTNPTACDLAAPTVRAAMGLGIAQANAQLFSFIIPSTNKTLAKLTLQKNTLVIGSEKQGAILKDVVFATPDLSGLKECNGTFHLVLKISQPFTIDIPYSWTAPATATKPAYNNSPGFLRINVPVPAGGLKVEFDINTAATGLEDISVDITNPTTNALDAISAANFDLFSIISATGPIGSVLKTYKPLLTKVGPLLKTNLLSSAKQFLDDGLASTAIGVAIDRILGRIYLTINPPFNLAPISTTMPF